MRRIDNRACDAAACEEETVKVMVKHDTCKTKGIQDGPSLESSLCLNVSLKYPGTWDPGTLEPLDLGTLGPWDSWTLGLWELFPPPPPPPISSSYTILPPFICSFLLLLS